MTRPAPKTPNRSKSVRTLDKISLREQDRRAVKAAAAILRQQFPVEQVVLFGSKARGDDDAESDIDLLVLTGRLMSWQERREITNSLFDLQLELEVVISTLIVPLEEWERGLYQVLPIRREVEREGVAA